MTDPTPVAVTSRSFSRHPVLRSELLAWFSDVRFNDSDAVLAGETLVAFLSDREKAIMALDVVDDGLLARLPHLKLVSKFGVGLDTFDVDALGRRGVALAWTPGTNSRSVSELVLGTAIALLRHVVPSHLEVGAGRWRQRKGGCLSGRTVGIIGFGHVGRDLAELLQPFGCPVLCYDVAVIPDRYTAVGVRSVSLEDLLRTSDVVTIHVGLNDSTRDLLSAERLALMKPDALLINAARGQIVDEAALKTMLKTGRLAGAALDVFAVEPPVDRELVSLPNVIATPHIGGSTEEAILAMGRAAIAGLRPGPA